MVNFNLWGEIFQRAESLVPLIYLVISCYIIYLCFLKRELPQKERRYLVVLSLSLILITILMTIRILMPFFVSNDVIEQLQPFLAVNLLILIAPAHLYNKIKVVNKELNVNAALLIYSLMLITNIFVIVILYNLNYGHSYLKNTLISLTGAVILSIIIVNIIKLYKSKESHNSIISFTIVNHTFLLILLGIITFAYLFYLYKEKIKYEINGFEIILSVLNLFFILKMLNPYLKSEISDSSSVNESERSFSIERRIAEENKNDEIKERLVAYFESDKPFLRSDLTIQEVSLYLYTNKTYISRVINDSFGHNFNQFVNYYRIEEAKKLFFNDTQLNIQQLCDLSGFGSMATFTIAFRFFVGRSPADWCKDQKAKLGHEKDHRR